VSASNPSGLLAPADDRRPSLAGELLARIRADPLGKALLVLLLLLARSDRMIGEIEGAKELAITPLRRREKPRQPGHLWTLHADRHWQIFSPLFEDPAATDEAEQNRGSCPTGMIEIEGNSKRAARPYVIESLQSQTCLDWLQTSYPQRCAQFDEEAWIEAIARIPTVNMRFCIDRFEYPNIKGQFPWILVTWNEAADLCAEQRKRLCSEDEWTFACEGEEAVPFPYGYTRSPEACVIDRAWRDYDDDAWGDRSSRAAMLELDRLWQGEASGARPACRSPYGVYDMTGNVDEWTTSTEDYGYRSVLKGGYWGPVRARCRSSTRAHDEDFAYYQQGFRCCSDL